MPQESEPKKKITETAKDFTSKLAKSTKEYANKAGQFAQDSIPASLAFLSLPDLLKWSESITKSSATVFDKALDAKYLATHIGGGNHRMFDGGHDLFSAWDAIKNTNQADGLTEEVVAYTTAIWKDVTTLKGLPFVTWSKESYESSAEWVASYVPGASKSWFYDLMSFDIFEVLSVSLSSASALFFLSRDDTEKLSELLGSMGITSILSANPLMGMAVVFCTAYAYFIKKNNLDGKQFAKGASLAGMSAAIFGVLGMPLLIELGIVIVVSKLIRNTVFENKELLKLINMKTLVATNKLNPTSMLTSFKKLI